MLSQQSLYRKLGPAFRWPVSPNKQSQVLARGIRILNNEKIIKHPQSLNQQPFDSALLRLSKLFLKSRKLYLESGAKFYPTLVSTPRSLSSPILIEQRIEYSPIEKEMNFAACDPHQKRNLGHLLELRSYCSSLFHEQSHRLLWKLLPPPPIPGRDGALRRYLNFAESLVIVTDMALGDELGPRIASFFYLSGVIYDPGTTIRREGYSKRDYRNYLQAAVLATYMTLELYSKKGIEDALKVSFPNLGELRTRAAKRSLCLDTQFVTTTNQTWQSRYSKLLYKTLSREGVTPLELPDDPYKNWNQYVIAEKWFEKLGL
ncbi:MAG: hypothetical protein AABZ55_03770 [Bdellovibrionota bacterium]